MTFTETQGWVMGWESHELTEVLLPIEKKDETCLVLLQRLILSRISGYNVVLF